MASSSALFRGGRVLGAEREDALGGGRGIAREQGRHAARAEMLDRR